MAVLVMMCICMFVKGGYNLGILDALLSSAEYDLAVMMIHQSLLICQCNFFHPYYNRR